MGLVSVFRAILPINSISSLSLQHPFPNSICVCVRTGKLEFPAVYLGNWIVVGLCSSEFTLSLAVSRRTLYVACTDKDVTDLGLN